MHKFAGRWRLALLVAGLLGFSVPTAWPQNPPSLVAPVYPGATSGCGSMAGTEGYTGNMFYGYTKVSCFATRDRLDKVRGFYEGKGASFDEMAPGTHFAAILDVMRVTTGQASEGDKYRGVWLIKRASPPDPVKASDAELREWAAKSRHFKRLSESVAWDAERESTQSAIGRPTGNRSIKEFREILTKYSHLETAFYPEGKPRDRGVGYTKGQTTPVDEELAEVYTKRSQEAFAAYNQEHANDFQKLQQAHQQALQQAQQQPNQDDPQVKAANAELARRIQANPKLAKDVPAKMQRSQELMRDGKRQEAMQLGMDLNTEMRSDPAVAEQMDKIGALMNRQYEQRQTASAGQQQAAARSANDKYGWGLWVEYLQELNKIPAYWTVIQITQKDPQNDTAPRAPNAKDRACLLVQVRDPHYAERDYPKGGPPRPTACDDASSRQGRQPAQAGQPTQPENTGSGSGTDNAVKAGKQGLNLIKKLF